MYSMIAAQVNQARANRALGERLAALDFERTVSAVLKNQPTCSALLTSTNMVQSSIVLSSAMASFNPPVIDLMAISLGGTNLATPGNSASALADSLRVAAAGIKLTVTSPNLGTLAIKFDQTKLIQAIPDLSFPVQLQSSSSDGGISYNISGCTGDSPQSMCSSMGGMWSGSQCSFGSSPPTPSSICLSLGGTWSGSACAWAVAGP